MSPVHALLGLLLDGERYGYDLKRTIDQEFAPFWRIDFGQLYRSLAKMQRNGWVKTRVEPGAGGPNRKVYALTSKGRRAFAAWLAEPAGDQDELLVKLRLSAIAGVPVPALVDSQRRVFEGERTDRHRTQQDARSAGDPGRLVLAHAALRETEATLAALDLYSAIMPSQASVPKLSDQPIITGSDDPLLARLAHLVRTSASSVGSIGGLLALSQHQADVAGIHLLDPETGEYNIPFVKRLLPEDDIVLVNLAFRENGLMLTRGNPKGIIKLRDLARRGIRFINRPRGTGTRLLLYSRLRAAHVDPHALPDWEHSAATHDAVAGAIATGAADAGPGVRAVAAAWDLEFIPLGEERFDLAIPRAEYESPRLQSLLQALHSKEFRQTAAALPGYDLARMGRVVARVR